MNHDDSKQDPDLQPFLEPALEARVVAWVLGEASAFEAAELERLCAEQPELAIFKRRITAVHGLTGQAARPEMQPLRLSPERRDKLRRTLDGESAPSKKTAAFIPPMARSGLAHRLSQFARPYAVSACVAVAVLGTIAAFLVPSVGTVRESSRRTMAESEERQEQQRALIADSERRKAEREQRASAEENARGPRSIGSSSPTHSLPAPTASPTPSVARGSADLPMPALARPPVDAVTPWNSVDSDPDRFGETIALSPFEVTTEGDVGYTASNTLAGNRLNTQLRDIGASVSVLNQQFLDDTAAAPPPPGFLEYTTNTNVAGKEEGRIGWAGGGELSPREPNSILFGSGDSRGYFGMTESTLRRDGSGRVRGLDKADNARNLEGVDPFITSQRLSQTEMAKDAKEAEVVQLTEYKKRDAQLTEPRGRISGEKTKPSVAPAIEETSTTVEPTSTFSLHVSDVSFRLAQAALARGEVPDPARIRPEEFYNAFDYGDPAPAAAEKIACRIEQAAHPVLQQRNLVRIAVRVPATGRGAGQPLRLTVLLDTSGSMERADRVASVQRALDVLGSLLGPNDRVTVIGFARTPRLLVEGLPGDQAATRLAELAAQTPAEGGTNLEAALELAITKAQQHFHAPAQNRIVLITDGAANLGNADPEQLNATIKAARDRGLAFDACGVGTDGLDDAILEALTRQGDGRYYLLDSPADADAGFARQLAGAFRPAAQNVKLQVRFNPARVAHYRLIGFEQHRLREEDFRNDQVDAAELAPEEAAVAVYQVAVLPEGEGELGDVFVRFRDTAANEMVERSWTMPFEARARSFDRATPTVQLAGVAVLLAERLRGGAMADLVRFDELAPVVNALRDHYAGNARVQQLATMVEQARRMAGE